MEAVGGAGPTRTVRSRLRAAAVAAGSDYHELTGWAAVARQLRDTCGDGATVALAPSLHRAEPQLSALLTEAGLQVLVPGTRDPVAEVADVPVGLVRGELAVAETGSVLVAEHELADRVVTMLCRHLVQVVERGAVVEDLDRAGAWLAERAGQPGFASLMTGPSRTADIERSLTIGVQGPDRVDVVVLDPDAAAPDPAGAAAPDAVAAQTADAASRSGEDRT